MKHLRVAILVAAISMPASALAGELVLTFKDGRVTLKATDASQRQILNEWARLGQTRMTGLERLTGSPLTLEPIDVPEKQALEILLRSVAGYIAAPRAVMASASVSRFNRLALLPTSIASAAPMGATARGVCASAHGVCASAWDALSRFDAVGQRGGRPGRLVGHLGIPVFSPNAEPLNPALVPAGPSRGPASSGGRFPTIRMGHRPNRGRGPARDCRLSSPPVPA